MGVVRFSVTCSQYTCRHTGQVTFEAVGLDDSTLFPDITELRRFVCTVCGSRNVNIMPDWRTLNAVGLGRNG